MVCHPPNPEPATPTPDRMKWNKKRGRVKPNRKKPVTTTNTQKSSGHLWRLKVDGMGKNTKSEVVIMKWNVPEHTTIKKTKNGKKTNTQREPGTTGDVVTCANRLMQMLERFETTGRTFTKDDARLLQAWLLATANIVEHVGHSKKTAFRLNQGKGRAGTTCDKLKAHFDALADVAKWA